MAVRRIGLSTGGGDAPGLNAVLRAATLAALERGWEVIGIRHGFRGLIDPCDAVVLDRASVRGITNLGGTILGTDNSGRPFQRVVSDPEGTERTVDIAQEVVDGVKRLGLDALIVVGGDSSMAHAYDLWQRGVPAIGVPKTIDNDLECTMETFGFDTAVAVATDAIDRLHSTAEAHERVFVVEVMGRNAGWIALHSGVAGGADVILIPEIPFDWESIFNKVRKREAMGRHFTMVVVAEGAYPRGGETVVREREASGKIRLGGVGQQVSDAIEENTGKETRCVVLGHLQRGGRPTARDRVLALGFGAAAVRAAAAGEFGVMVSLDPPVVRTVPLECAIHRQKRVPADDQTLLTARAMGLCVGD
jgi:6-phosphofructokinase 1